MDEINDNNIDQQEEVILPEDDDLDIDLQNAGILTGISNQVDYEPVLKIQAQILEQQDKNISFLLGEINKLKRKTTKITIVMIVYFLVFLLLVFKLWVK